MRASRKHVWSRLGCERRNTWKVCLLQDAPWPTECWLFPRRSPPRHRKCSRAEPPPYRDLWRLVSAESHVIGRILLTCADVMSGLKLATTVAMVIQPCLEHGLWVPGPKAVVFIPVQSFERKGISHFTPAIFQHRYLMGLLQCRCWPVASHDDFEHVSTERNVASSRHRRRSISRWNGQTYLKSEEL